MKQLLLPLFFFAILICSVSAANYTVKENYAFVGPKLCHINGQLEFGITTFRGNRNVQDIKGIGMRFNNTITYDTIPGKWYDEDYNEINVIRKGEKAIFVSNESVFRSVGNYTILLANRNITETEVLQINFFTGKNILEDGTGLQFTVHCSGMTHLCDAVNLTIPTCNNTPEGFFAVFNGISNASIDVDEDIEYLLNYRLLVDEVQFELPPYRTKIVQSASGSYTLSISKRSLAKPIESIRIRVKDCNDKLHKTKVYRGCSVPKELTANDSALMRNATTENESNISLPLAQANQSASLTMPDQEAEGAKPDENVSESSSTSESEQPPASGENLAVTYQLNASAESTIEPKSNWLKQLFSWIRSFFS